MYGTQNLSEKISKKCNEDYDLCNSAASPSFIMQWSPRNESHYLSRSKYATPRQLSKSVPRRSQGFICYNTNRSLNFDIGTRNRDDCFKSPNSSSDSSNRSTENENYLSRSAKILRALNIDYSPLKSTKSGTRKINKSLNFDQSPSSKSLLNLKKCSSSALTKKLPSSSKINRTLNFESSGESSVNSRLDSSVESTDENQNQTPSQRYRRVKKSLTYPSPKFTPKSLSSPNMSARSPRLRTDLREKIEDIIQNNNTPNLQSSRRNLVKMKCDNFGASTPRNLFNDFDDADDEEAIVTDQDNNRPGTPENFIKIVPESMNAIKKSHKKERVLGRLGKAITYKADVTSVNESFIDEPIDTEREEKLATTPSNSTNDNSSPHSNINTLRHSHKKDKSKRTLYNNNSEDEMSDISSIFDYSETRAIVEGTPSMDDENDKNLTERRDSLYNDKDEQRDEKCLEAASVENSVSIKKSEILMDVDAGSGNGLEIKKPIEPCSSVSYVNTTENNVTTPEKLSRNSSRPETPENRINFLQHIMTDSIKKSHKKIKDSNRKSLFKSRLMQNEEKDRVDPSESTSGSEVNRAVTPENTNSSRLLLSQFSSVKKSHKKDKHRRMLSGSLQRKKFFAQDGGAISNSDSDFNDCSFSSCHSELTNLSPPRVVVDSVTSSAVVDNEKKLASSPKSSQSRPDPHDLGIKALSSLDLPRSSPNKRKNVSGDSEYHSVNQESASTSYESGEEEFKIFTPIKKRRSLKVVTPIGRRISDEEASRNNENSKEEESEDAIPRCSTPTSGRGGGGCLTLIEKSMKTPTISAVGFVTITDHSGPLMQQRNPESNDGRATPKNQSTLALIPGINSIKKSHKKDKRASLTRRSLMDGQETREPQSELALQENARASTSYENNDQGNFETMKETNQQVKTPPNHLQARNYLRILQMESIKRSHKKVRDRKRRSSIVPDTDLSDDGSIFDEAERSISMENEGLLHPESDNIDAESPIQNKEQLFRAHASPLNLNLSNDGSIFGDEDKLTDNSGPQQS